MVNRQVPGRRELELIAFFFGFAAAVSQVILIRELLGVFRGNEFIIGIIFSAWFLGIYFGARLSSGSDPAAMAQRVRISAFMLPVVLAVSVYGSHVISVIIPRVAGTFYSFSAELALSLLFAVPVGFIIGWFFPPLVSLVSREAGEESGGRVYYIESAGSFIGGLAFSFILVELFNPLQIIILLFVFSLLICLWNKKTVLVPLLIILTVLFFQSRKIEFALFGGLWQREHSGNLAAYERTRYQAVALGADRERISVYGDGIFLYSLPDTYEARQVFHLIMALKEKKGGRILLFGGGPGSVLYNLLLSGAGVYYCESDPGMWRMVRPHVKRMYGIGEGSAGLKIIRRDIKEFLLHSNERFDMIVNLASTPENIMLNRYFTREFYALCRSRLNDGGIVIASVKGFSNYMNADSREFILSIYKAFKNEFPVNMVTSGDVMYLVGSVKPGAFPEDPAALIERYGKRLLSAGDAPYEKEIVSEFSPAELSMLFEKSQLDYFRDIASRSIRAVKENRDLKPRGYWNHIMISSLEEKSVFYRLLSGAVFIPLLALVMLAAALADAAVRRGRRGAAGGFFIYVAGFTGITVVMVMILLHQMLEGIVYHRVALINACFMLGLAAGGFTFTKRKILSPAAVFLLMVLSLGLVYGYMTTGYDIFFWPGIILFSFLNGGVFPLLFPGMHGIDFHERARLLDSMEHLGAISGAMVAALFLVPVTGIGGTLLFSVALLLAASLMCRFLMRQDTVME